MACEVEARRRRTTITPPWLHHRAHVLLASSIRSNVYCAVFTFHHLYAYTTSKAIMILDFLHHSLAEPKELLKRDTGNSDMA
jgi:hypothetical protein